MAKEQANYPGSLDVLNVDRIAGQVVPSEGFDIIETAITEMQAEMRRVTTKTGVATLTSSEGGLILVSAAAPYTLGLPTAVGNKGLVYLIVKTDDNTNLVTLDADGTETINGSLTYTDLNYQWAFVAVKSDNANWVVLYHSTNNLVTKTGTLVVGDLVKVNNISGIVEPSGVATETALTATSDAKIPTSKAVAEHKKLAQLFPSIYRRDIKWALKTPYTTAANRYTIQTPNKLSVDVNGTVYFIESQSDIDLSVEASWDTVAVDYRVAATRAGKDFYIYACVPGSGDAPTIKLIVNSTVPTGYTADNSRKIGGFHCLCVAVGTIGGHTLTNFVAGDVLPASVWDLRHRAVCENEGMVYDEKSQVWVDIYLASGTGASTASVNGGTISDTRNWMDFVDDGGAVGKRMLSDIEFQLMATGVREEAQIWNRTDPETTGGHIAYFLLTVTGTPTPNDWTAGDILTGTTSGRTCTIVEKITDTTYLCKNILATGFTAAETLTASGTGTGTATYSSWAADSRGRIISNIGCEDCCGVLHQWLNEQSYRLDGADFAAAKAFDWYDLPGDKGSLYRQADYGDVKLIAGGYWATATICGSRCRYASHCRWNTYASIGCRFGAEPRKAE